MKKFIVISIVLLMLAGFAITSSAMDFILWADQIIDVGTLTVERDVDCNLVVTYNITNPEWELGETHLYVGIDPPTKSAPGRFPYGPEDAVDGVYTIDLADFVGATTLYIAAQAEIGMIDEFGDPVLDPDTEEQIEETAWAEGTQIRTGKNWAMYFNIRLLPTISSEGLDDTYDINTDIEFTIRTVNPECGCAYDNVLFNYTIEEINLLDDIASFEYLDGTIWKPMPMYQVDFDVEGFFGPWPDGFEMLVPYDEFTTFKINIKTAGTYEVTMTLDNLNSPFEQLAILTQDVVFNNP